LEILEAWSANISNRANQNKSGNISLGHDPEVPDQPIQTPSSVARALPAIADSVVAVSGR